MNNRKRLICLLTAATLLTGGLVSTKTTASELGGVYFADNFEGDNSSNWELAKGSWNVVEDGTKVFRQTSTSVEGRAVIGNEEWENYSLEADIKVNNFNGSNRALLCGRYKDANNYYAVSLSSKNGGLVELRKKVNGSSIVLDKANVSIEAGKWYNTRLEMNGTSLKVYINDKLVIETEDTSYDNVKVLGDIKIDEESKNESVEDSKEENSKEDISDSVVEDSKEDASDSIVEDSKEEENEEGVVNLNQYSVEGFAEGNIGGGIIDETSSSYAKVSNATELAQALKKKSKIKVIEITNDIALGWNEIESSAKVAPITQNIEPLTHPTLKKSGVSKITVDSFDGLTIYSKNGAKLTHAGFVF